MPETELTDKQREVLALHREGKSPTEISEALGVSSQGVHGHLRRLRDHGHIPAGASKPAAAKSRPSRAQRPDGQPFSAAAAIDALKAAIDQQHAALDTREAEIAAEIDRMQAERAEIQLAPPRTGQAHAEGTEAEAGAQGGGGVITNTVFVTVVLGVIAGNVAMMGLVVKVLGDRIGDLARRMDSSETRANERHDVYMAKFDGLTETVARFDECLN